MEHEEWWMNDAVRENIEDIQQTYGFEEREALAFWHLAHARDLMADLAIADRKETEKDAEEAYSALGAVERGAQQIADSISFAAQNEARVFQHFEALFDTLGARVLRRAYPQGWGGKPDPAEEE